MKPLTLHEKQQFIQEGYLGARQLLPPGLVVSTRRQLLAALSIDRAVDDT